MRYYGFTLNVLEQKGNLVHYVIAGRSAEATNDMAETLMSRLYEAKRISTRRMVVMKEIAPDICKGNSSKYLEEMIENNFGGAVVIDLSERFGHNAVSYGQACEYLEKLIKKYRNDCLFIFTYNMDKPGFSYSILPQLKKYEIPDDFLLDRDENAESSYDKLQKKIGLGIVKEQIDKIVATDIVEKERKKRNGNAYQAGTMHMIFSGL